MDNSQKTQIDKLMELKQLYEQGILTKEEMLSEKRKILGKDSESAKETAREKNTMSPESQQQKCEVENHVGPIFQKYNTYIIGGIVLLLVMAGIIFVPKMITHPTVPVSDNKIIPEIKTLALKGSINDKIGFTMHLSIRGNEIEGKEHYDNQRAEVKLTIKGVYSENGRMILFEYDGNTTAGFFEGTIERETYSGTFTNSKGKTFPFSAKILTESALARIEQEEALFETNKVIYKNNSKTANVYLSADYPTRGPEALLQETRKYISKIVSELFNINEYSGSLNDGNSVIKSYGETKFVDLDREWKLDRENREEAYEGAPEYIEEIEIIKDYENVNCVSLSAHYYYFHGGVSNRFLNASTFRKADGKSLHIIKSNNNKELHNLIISAVKNKLGDDYESVNEEFESSPVPNIMHLVKDGVQFDYQHYQIGPGSLGQVSITIPYDKIKPYMTEEAKNVLGK